MTGAVAWGLQPAHESACNPGRTGIICAASACGSSLLQPLAMAYA